jgi:hypothetical protein
MPLWHFEEAVEEMRMTMFKCCNSELLIKMNRKQLMWPNAYDHREVFQGNGMAALSQAKTFLKAMCPAIETDYFTFCSQ